MTNYLAHANVVRYGLRQASSISFVLVASIAGLTSGGPGLTAYGAAKSATIGLTRTLAQELAPHHRVNCVCPGWTDTPFNDPVIARIGGREKWESSVKDTVPLKRAARPEEVATVILDVARWSYATGAVIVVDGGLSL
jgi:dihydroanticapsin dehydrogenase